MAAKYEQFRAMYLAEDYQAAYGLMTEPYRSGHDVEHLKTVYGMLTQPDYELHPNHRTYIEGNHAIILPGDLSDSDDWAGAALQFEKEDGVWKLTGVLEYFVPD